MNSRLSLWAIPLTVLVSGSWLGCGSYGGGDETPSPSPSPTPTEPTPTPAYPTETPLADPVTISGTVSAVDPTTGESLDASTYAARCGAIVVYALRDPADLAHPVAKSTLAGPGYYSMLVAKNSGKLYVVGLADVNSDEVITNADMAREALSSPLTIVEDDATNVDIQFDLSPRGGGGPTPPTGPFSGVVTYTAQNADSTNIAVVAFPGDYTVSHLWGKTERTGGGDFALDVYTYSPETSLVGYADKDGNGLYEPSDPAGLAEGNPHAFDTSGKSGVQIVIEGVLDEGLPQPIPYITLSGTVDGGDQYSGTPIQVMATGASGSVTYANKQLPGEGNFDLRVPGNLGSATVFAITDSDGDGNLNPGLDANAAISVSVMGSNIGGLHLTLVPPVYETGVRGTVSYGGSVGASDQLVIALFDDPEHYENAVAILLVDPLFPVDYEMLDVEPGTYYLISALDVNGDWSGTPGPEDVIGAYTDNGTTAKPVVVEENQVTEDIDLYIGNFTPDF